MTIESKFISENNMAALYKAYTWNNDKWLSGFHDICQIELLFARDILNLYISREAIMTVVSWGKLRNPRVTCPEKIYFTAEELTDIRKMYSKIYCATSGLGPTYISKVLRFANPYIAGAIDTRIVRAFGKGDAASVKYSWLDLEVTNQGYGWYINKHQSNWPNAYYNWLQILDEIKRELNQAGIECPHPNSFIDSNLRYRGVWTSADVEMALFTYSSQQLRTGST